MRILIVTPEEEEVGGVQNVIGNLTRHLQSRGHDVVYFHAGSGSKPNVKLSSRGITTFGMNLQLPFGDRPRIVSLPLFLIRFPVAIAQLIRIIRKNKIQIVNIHFPADTACYFAICRRILGIKVVTSVHGADLFPGGKAKAEYSRAIRLLLNGSDRIVAPSQSYRNDVAVVFPSLNRKIEAIHNGVNFDEMDGPGKDSAMAAPDRYLLCIAMHNEKKGLDVLLRAFARLESVEPEVKLALVGDGPLRPDLEALAASLGISGKVRFLGRRGRTQVSGLLQRCEIFVLPSRAEPFGIVLIEAMACRKPVIATRVGGIPEIVEDGRNGILVEPDNPKALADALVTMLQNPELRTSLANKGFETVHEKFSSEAMGKAYESLFAELIRS